MNVRQVNVSAETTIFILPGKCKTLFFTLKKNLKIYEGFNIGLEEGEGHCFL